MHPVTEETLTFEASNVLFVDGSRSHHPVSVFEGGALDDEDWFYRVIDKYDGPIVARYDHSYGPSWDVHKKKIVGVVLMSFQDWKEHSPRVCDNAKKPEYTFKTLKRQLAAEELTRLTSGKRMPADLPGGRSLPVFKPSDSDLASLCFCENSFSSQLTAEEGSTLHIWRNR